MDLKHQVESLLFSSGRSMTDQELSELTKTSLNDVKKSLEELKQDYDSRDTSLVLINTANSWKLNVREKYIDLVTKIVADTELSFPLLETLSVIAHRAPVVQAEIIKARGTNAYEHIQELVEAGFVERIKDGRSFKIGLTPKFFEYFEVEGEQSLKQLLKDVKPSEPKRPKKLGDLDVVDLKSEGSDADPEKQLMGDLEVVDVAVEPVKRVIAPLPTPKPAAEMIRPDDDFLKKIDEQIDQISKRNDQNSDDEDFKPKSLESQLADDEESSPGEGEQAEADDQESGSSEDDKEADKQSDEEKK